MAMRPAVTRTRTPSARLAQADAERSFSRARAALPPRAIASSGSPAPTAYATTRAIVAPDPGAVTARLVTAPRIGPAHGVQTRPRLTPVTRPPTNPGWAILAPMAGKRAVARS